jgi:hypothetical protein
MPIGIGEVSAAIPLSATLAVLLSGPVARLIDARNSLAKLFFGLYGR